MLCKEKIDARVGEDRLIDALNTLGIPIVRQGRRNFINLRNEHTPSAVLNPDGSFYDFGSGESGTLIDILMRLKGMSLQDAIREAKKLLHIDSVETEEYVSKQKPIQTQQAKTSLDEKTLLKKSNYFVQLSKQNQYRKQFLELLKELLPSIENEDRRLAIAGLFKIGIRTNPTPMLTMPIMDENDKVVNIWKYNKHATPKILFEGGGTELAFPLNKLKEFSKNEKVLLVCEGQKDVLNAIAHGYDAITAGSCVCIFKEKHLQFFKDKRVVVYGDYDEGGDKFSKNIKEQLDGIAKEVLSIQWENVFQKNGVLNPHRGFDLTDLLKLKKDQR